MDHIGDDAAAGAVWMEYAAFLRNSPKELWPAGPAGSDATQRMAALRTLYQRALWVPMGKNTHQKQADSQGRSVVPAGALCQCRLWMTLYWPV